MSTKLYDTSTEFTFGDDSDESYLPCESRKTLKTKVLNKKKSCTTTIVIGKKINYNVSVGEIFTNLWPPRQ